ncbi:uncharacterized protein Pyn_17267 [Prunus yedoensis var. nudiflora]|uniref:Uncharacterized protein n=1 Tax=Prunus yedoensis var. nudiflora TaxID=2094558 RepID=A0A314UIA0_PRUYE|nr:uncharacterized protein Pyn_17267 [Prunus yedoensis var. nudiflora]
MARVMAPPMARVMAPSFKAPAVVGTPKTLAHRTVPSPSPVRPSAAVAPGRKRSREAVIFEAAAAEAVQTRSAAVEVEVSEPLRKRLLLILSEGEDKEEGPPVAGAAADVEAVGAEALVVEEIIADAADGEEAVAEVTTGEAADAEAAAGEAEATESPLAALAEVPRVIMAVPSPTATASIEPSFVAPRRPSGIMFRSPPRASLPLSTATVSSSPPTVMVVSQEPLAEDESVVLEPLALGTSTLTPVTSVNVSMPQPPLSQESTVMTELAVTETSIVPPAAEEPASSDDLAEL